MIDKGYSGELERALARPDADQMCLQIDACVDCYTRDKDGAWPEEEANAFEEILLCFHDDPDKALAYVIIGASRTDEARFLRLLGCGPLEDVLEDPSVELLERIVAEALTSDRFRWLLSNPFKISIAPRAWEAIERFRITGPHEEPSDDKLPPQK